MVLENSASWEPARENLDPLNLMPEGGLAVPNIKVLGIGGGGSNAVSRMFKEKLPVVEYYAVNTDLNALLLLATPHHSLQQGLVDLYGPVSVAIRAPFPLMFDSPKQQSHRGGGAGFLQLRRQPSDALRVGQPNWTSQGFQSQFTYPGQLGASSCNH